jgi:ketosteroid isomerase-like protein
MPEESTTFDMVAATRRSNGAIIRRDFDAVLAIFWPDAVFDTSPVGTGVFEGREAIRGFYEDWFGSYEDFEQVIEEAHDLGSDVGLAVYLQRGRPAGSSGFVELRYAGVAIWRHGLVERFTLYTDIDEARATAKRLAEERHRRAGGEH